MGQGYELKNKRYKRFAFIFLFLLWGYFAFHLMVSERSIPSLMILSAQNEILDAQLMTLQSERIKLHDRVTRLRPQTLDADLLEEQAMVMLGTTGGNSIIILDGRDG